MATNSVLAKLAIQISGNTAELGKALSQSQSQLKSFQNSVSGIGQALGISFGAVAIFNGIKAGIGIIAEFESTMSEVKAITGATGKEFNDLQKDALRLGSATKFTATQVGQLQVAYGRLGFNTKEILDATEATLDLAAATGEDLAKSADVAGSTVRGFGLEARETQRIVDVMAASFNKTALGLDNFTESMKYVAPIAAAANISVEETTALLGVLADAGIRGSTAGTALRKIFGDLSKDGRPVNERLDELGKKGITLSDSFDEVGRTAQTALLVLTKNRDKADELTRAFSNVEGEAARMARTMADNLTGDVDKLSSAFEGLILKLKSGFFRGVVQGITSTINAITGSPDLELYITKLTSAIKQGGFNIDPFIEKLKDIRREQGKPIDLSIISELTDKYKLTGEQANELYVSLLEVNKALSFQEKTIQNFDESALVARYGKTTEALDKYKQGIYDLILAQQIQQSQTQKLITPENKDVFGPIVAAADETIANYRRVIDILNVYGETFVKSESKVQAATVATVKNLNFYQEALKKVNEAFESLALVQEASGKFTDKTLSGLRILAAEGAGLEDFIKRVNRLKESFRNIDVVIKPPDLTPLTNVLKTIEVTAGSLTFETTISSFDQVTERFEDGLKRMAASAKQNSELIKDSFLDMTPVIHSALSGIAQALGNAIGGGESFGKALLGVLGGVLVQFGEMLLTVGLGIIAFNLSLKSLNPYVALAAGVGLIAVGTDGGASIKKLGGGGSAGGGSSMSGMATQNVSRSRNSSPGDRIQFDVKFDIEGTKLVGVLANTNNKKQRSG